MRFQAGTFLGSLLRKSPIADEQGPVPAQHQVAAFTTETREIADIARATDKQGIEAFITQDLSQPLPAALGMIKRHVRHGYSLQNDRPETGASSQHYTGNTHPGPL